MLGRNLLPAGLVSRVFGVAFGVPYPRGRPRSEPAAVFGSWFVAALVLDCRAIRAGDVTAQALDDPGVRRGPGSGHDQDGSGCSRAAECSGWRTASAQCRHAGREEADRRVGTGCPPRCLLEDRSPGRTPHLATQMPAESGRIS